MSRIKKIIVLLFWTWQSTAFSLETLGLETATTFSSSSKYILTPMIGQKIFQKNYKEALILVNQGIDAAPYDADLWLKKAEIFVEMEDWLNASDALEKALQLNPNLSPALSLKEKLQQQSFYLRNELGFDQSEAYVSDLKSYWTFSSLHYYRFFPGAKIGGRINYANRYNANASQYQFEAYPRLTREILMTITAAFADMSQILYPQKQFAIEPYIDLGHGFEFSGGARYLDYFHTEITTVTGSLGYYFGNQFLWYRPYYYQPKTAYYSEIGLTHFLDNKLNFITLKGGVGNYPDIADLAPLNQIINLKAWGLDLSGQFQIWTKGLYFRPDLGYAHQVFPNGRLRQITNLNLGLMYQF